MADNKSQIQVWILCQVTSNPYADPRAIKITNDDFKTGSLQGLSYTRQPSFSPLTNSVLSVVQRFIDGNGGRQAKFHYIQNHYKCCCRYSTDGCNRLELADQALFDAELLLREHRCRAAANRYILEDLHARVKW